MPADVKNLKEFVGGGGSEASIRQMFLGMQMQTEILTLDEGQYVSPRSTALADTLLLVLGGEGVVELGDEVLVLTRHMTVLVPPGETAGIINEGVDPLIMLRVTSPPE